jgi:hypothetical protein
MTDAFVSGAVRRRARRQGGSRAWIRGMLGESVGPGHDVAPDLENAQR